MNEIGKVNLKENGEEFTDYGCGINTYYSEIEKEEYDRIKAIENYEGKLSELYQSTMPDYIRYGYGFYGCYICQRNDKYFYATKIGSSCD